MKEKKPIKIQNLYDCMDPSKEIDEAKLVKEVKRVCHRVRLFGEEETKIYYYEEKAKEPTNTTVKKLSELHKAIIVLAATIMGENFENVARIFFGHPNSVKHFFGKDRWSYFESAKSIRKLRKYCISFYGK